MLETFIVKQLSFSLATKIIKKSSRKIKVVLLSATEETNLTKIKCMASFTLYRTTFDPTQKCSFSLTFTLYRITFDQTHKCSFSLAFTLYRIILFLIQKCSFSLAFTLYRYSFGAVQVQNCSSFLAGIKLYLMSGTKLYRITLSSVNARLILNNFVSYQKVIWYSVNAAYVIIRHQNLSFHSG